MERMGIEFDRDLEEKFGPTLNAVIRTCQLCRSSGLCSDWLAHAPVMVSRAPPFCPYADRLDVLVGDEGRSGVGRHTIH
jgi:hypothetical protein